MASKGLTKVLGHGRSTITRASRCVICQQRAFSSSPIIQKNGAVPHLSTETSSAELTALLSTLRRNAFLPAHLSEQHKELIYRPKNQKMLQDDPVKVEIEGEEFQLQFIDRTKDVPPLSKSLFRAIDLFENKKDWDNLPQLLIGYKNVHQKLAPWQWEKMFRKAAAAGRMDVIVECLRQAPKTGVHFQKAETLARLMFWIQYEPAKNGWKAKESAKALKLAEEVLRTLEEKGMSVKSDHVAVNAAVVGVLLQLSAAVAKIVGSDANGKVKTYADRLLDITNADQHITQALSSESATQNDPFFPCLAPIIHGLKSAAKVLAPGNQYAGRAEQLRKRFDTEYEMWKDVPKTKNFVQENSLPAWCKKDLVEVDA